MHESLMSKTDGSPNPSHSTDKKCYQGRFGVSSTRQGALGFKDSAEDGKRMMAQHTEMDYSHINNMEPKPFEKGFAPEQNEMGGFNNSFKPNL